jgi:endonuclease/exonuclease/phosphatase family metal-dependent hydrolase
MLSDLKLAFWNVENLFEPQLVARGVVHGGPTSEEELEAKSAVLARAIDQFFDGHGPDLLGLAEIGHRQIVENVAARLAGGPHVIVWAERHHPNQTGLALLARESLIAEAECLHVHPDRGNKRPRSMIVRCALRGQRAEFLVIVNHWKAGRRREDHADREETAHWLHSQLCGLASYDKQTCVLAVGDFNAEPFSEPLKRLRTCRTIRPVLWRAEQAVLYNPSWRLLVERDCFVPREGTRYEQQRATTSQGEDEPRIIDQLLVSGDALLRKGPLRVREESLDLYCDERTATRREGVLTPARWQSAKRTGASDHFPLLCRCEINRE